MGSEKNHESAMGSEYISGIFNYCDKWCERCALSSRCMVFRAEAEKGRLNKTPEMNDEFWQEISDMFKETLVKLKQLMEERGIEMEEPTWEELDENEKLEQYVESHPLTLISETYFKQAHNWLNSNRMIITEKTDEYKRLFQSDPTNMNYIDKALKINDYVEIIAWYHSLITVKINRALFSKIFDDDSEDDEIQNDANGSAKVALKGVERSIVAWKELSDLLKEEDSEIYRQLAILMKIKEGIHQSFPGAEKFIRPGFDQ